MQTQPSAATTCEESESKPTKRQVEKVGKSNLVEITGFGCVWGCNGSVCSLCVLLDTFPRLALKQASRGILGLSCEQGRAPRTPRVFCMTLDEQLEAMLGETVKLYKDDGSFLVRGPLLREGQRFCKPNSDVAIKERWEVCGNEGTAVFESEVVKAICEKGIGIMLGVQFHQGEEYKQT